ncbi:hypothetical protein BMS83_01165 [Leuconostoc pseudomesenteroides]|nr:hypothetical protein BMS83_01165 [Leuconostoc pseudomesenteroides]
MSLLLKALSAWIIQQLDSQYHVEIQVPCQSYQAPHTIAFEPQQQFFDGGKKPDKKSDITTIIVYTNVVILPVLLAFESVVSLDYSTA